jgi:DNA-binding beta-propeller fold protein YncE
MSCFFICLALFGIFRVGILYVFMVFKTTYFRFGFYLAVLLILIGVAFVPEFSVRYLSGALISDGSNAVDMLGHYRDATAVDPVPYYTKGSWDNGPNKLGFSSPRDVEFDSLNHRLFIAAEGNGRVLVYNLNSNNTWSDYVPDNILGKSGYFDTTSSATQSGSKNPTSLVYDSENNLLYVADRSAHRVLVYHVASISDGENAVNVLGQSNFTSSSSSVSQSRINAPYGVEIDTAGNRLFVADTSNNRVLIFDVATLVDGENAVNVLGQADFVSGGASCTVGGMDLPYGLEYDSVNDLLYVALFNQDRVLVYDIATLVDGENAVNVLGQSDFVTCSGTTTQSSLNGPIGIDLDSSSNILYVADDLNHRIVTFDVSTLTDGENAVNVLGQADFTTNSNPADETGARLATQVLIDPNGLVLDTDNNLLYTSDNTRNRIMVFDVTSISNGENAVNVVGQYSDASLTPSYVKNGAYNGPSDIGLRNPSFVLVDGTHNRLFVADQANGRVLSFNLDAGKTLIDHIPDAILGSASMFALDRTSTATSLDIAEGLAYDSAGDRLFVSDSQDDRILVFDTATISNGESAINVLGQTTLTATGKGLTQAKLDSPVGMAYDSVNNYLYVADEENNRVMVFDVASITDGENAIYVLGQADFTSEVQALTQSGMYFPNDVALDTANNRLFVTAFTQNRVLVFDVSAITNGENAVNVLGQSDFTSNVTADGQAGMDIPIGVEYDSTNNRLFVSILNDNRILVFDTSVITDGENAINVIGQSNFTLTGQSTTQSGLYWPRGMSYDNTSGTVFVGDSSNNRVMVFDASGSGNARPDNPTSLGGASFVDGSTATDTTPTLSFTLADNDGADTVKYHIQIDDTSDFSSVLVDYTSALAAQGATSFTVGQAAGSGTYATGSAGQTLASTNYYWRVRNIDNSSSPSNFAYANSGSIAFTYALAPGTPSNLGPSILVNGSVGSDSTPTLLFTASDSNVNDTVQYQVQIDDSSDFGSLVVDYTSVLGSQGILSFTVGQAAGSGSYTTGAESQTLAGASYYWRVKVIDSGRVEGKFATANSGAVAFILNATPNVPASLGSGSLVGGGVVSSRQPVFQFILSDDDSADTVQFQIQIDDSSDFSSVVVDYTSALAVQSVNPVTFTVGQAVGSGTYTVGVQGQTLDITDYYWRVKTTDNSSAASAYSTANSGAVAFSISGGSSSSSRSSSTGNSPTSSGSVQADVLSVESSVDLVPDEIGETFSVAQEPMYSLLDEIVLGDAVSDWPFEVAELEYRFLDDVTGESSARVYLSTMDLVGYLDYFRGVLALGSDLEMSHCLSARLPNSDPTALQCSIFHVTEYDEALLRSVFDLQLRYYAPVGVEYEIVSYITVGNSTLASVLNPPLFVPVSQVTFPTSALTSTGRHEVREGDIFVAESSASEMHLLVNGTLVLLEPTTFPGLDRTRPAQLDEVGSDSAVVYGYQYDLLELLGDGAREIVVDGQSFEFSLPGELDLALRTLSIGLSDGRVLSFGAYAGYVPEGEETNIELSVDAESVRPRKVGPLLFFTRELSTDN